MAGADRRRVRRRVGGRAGDGRLDRRPHELALGVLRQPPLRCARPRRCLARLPGQVPRREHTVDWLGPACWRPASPAACSRWLWGGVQYPWGSPQVVGLFAALGRPARRLPRAGAARRGADPAARALPRPDDRRRAASRSSLSARRCSGRSCSSRSSSRASSATAPRARRRADAADARADRSERPLRPARLPHGALPGGTAGRAARAPGRFPALTRLGADRRAGTHARHGRRRFRDRARHANLRPRRAERRPADSMGVATATTQFFRSARRHDRRDRNGCAADDAAARRGVDRLDPLRRRRRRPGCARGRDAHRLRRLGPARRARLRGDALRRGTRAAPLRARAVRPPRRGAVRRAGAEFEDRAVAIR